MFNTSKLIHRNQISKSDFHFYIDKPYLAASQN
jgi:hypothetical protein